MIKTLIIWWQRTLAERREFFDAQARCTCRREEDPGPYSVPHTVRNPSCPEHRLVWPADTSEEIR